MAKLALQSHELLITGVMLLVVVFGWFATPAYGRLVAGLVIPHGDFAFDPALLKPNTPERLAADQVATAARRAGKWLGEVVDPDVILISTPHGQELSRDFAVYLNSYGSGFAELGADLHNNNISHYKAHLPRIHMAPDLSNELLNVLEITHDNVTGLLNFADSEDVALRWGEVIPLLLISQRPTNSTKKPRRHMVWSHPLRRYTQSPDMAPELLNVGHQIAYWAESRTERIALVVSSDLAHTHLADGPYGYSSASAPFDSAVGEWAKDPIHSATALLQTARNLQNKALSCGFTGLVLLHGALYGHPSSSSAFESRLLANRNATYYGMMVATFAPVKEIALDLS